MYHKYLHWYTKHIVAEKPKEPEPVVAKQKVAAHGRGRSRFIDKNAKPDQDEEMKDVTAKINEEIAQEMEAAMKIVEELERQE